MNIITIFDGNCGFIYCAVDTKTEKIVGVSLAMDSAYHNLEDNQYERTILMLLTVFVDKEYRGNGIGKTLIKMLEQDAAENNYLSINTTVYVPNTVGQQMLSKLGYAISAEERTKSINSRFV